MSENSKITHYHSVSGVFIKDLSSENAQKNQDNIVF